MCERIYSLLLRLYPASFREAYGAAAMELLRERLRDEPGFWPRLRLWLDLFLDLALSVPRTHRYNQQMPASVVTRRLSGAPSFDVLEDDPLRPRAMVFGGVLALAAFSGLFMVIGHAAALSGPDLSAPAIQRLFSFLTTRSTEIVPGDSRYQAAGSGVPSEARRRAKSQAAEAFLPAALAQTKIDAGERQRVTEAAISNLREHYFDGAVAERMAETLQAHENHGDYNAIFDGPAFAELLTKQIRDISGDKHLMVDYSADPLPSGPRAPPPGAIEQYHEALRQSNCTFEKVEILPNNIGYLKVNSFPDVSVCGPTAVAAMLRLNHADAIIFDLRDNRGGYPEMVSLIASWLFDRPVDWYNPRDNTAGPSRTQSPVSGSLLADKPVYVLTSGRTISGAEQFSYNLKMLKRATLVGETTRGSAHSGAFHRLDDHFGIGIPEAKPFNPYSKADWEGTGVEPDVKVSSADALETAKKLAQSSAGQETRGLKSPVEPK